MELLNATRLQAGYTMGMEPSGREHLVVVIKGTFRIPEHGQEAGLNEEQLPLFEADIFNGEPGFSAPLYEADYSPRKPRCDVLLNGSAYAPDGKPTNCVQVGLKIGPIAKTFAVVGQRYWEASAVSVRPSRAEMFTVMPISYDNAFGGIDNFLIDPDKHSAFMPNPVGRGYHQHLNDEFVDGTPMPSTQELNRPVTMPNRAYRPMAFGPVGRGWEPRYRLAGTYDQNWLDNTFPFLPADFDERYYQAAPSDQQMDYPQGGEEVILLNLTPAGRTVFRLPTITVPVVFFMKNYQKNETQAVMDTIVIEPDPGIFTLTWRSSLPLKKNMFEVVQVLVGTMPRGWWRAREMGKTYYRSLADLVATKRQEREEEK